MSDSITLAESSAFGALAFSADGLWLAAWDKWGRVNLWDARSGTLEGTITHETPKIILHSEALGFSPEGNLLVCFSVNPDPFGYGHIWFVEVRSVPNGELLRSLPLPLLEDERPTALAVSPGARLVAAGTCGPVHSLRVWNASSDESAWGLDEPGGEVCSLSFSHDGSRLAVANAAHSLGQVRVFEAETGRLIRALPRRDEAVGRSVVRQVRPREVRAEGVVSHEQLRKERAGMFIDWGPTNYANGQFVAFLPGGRLAATAEGRLLLWDAGLQYPLLSFPCSTSPTRCLDSADGRRMVTGGSLWNLEEPRLMRRPELWRPGPVHSMALSGDSSALATINGATDGSAILELAVHLWPLTDA